MVHALARCSNCQMAIRHYWEMLAEFVVKHVMLKIETLVKEIWYRRCDVLKCSTIFYEGSECIYAVGPFLSNSEFVRTKHSTIRMPEIHLQIEIVKAIPMKSQNEDIKTRSPLGIQFLFTIEFSGIPLGLLILGILGFACRHVFDFSR